MGFIPLGGAAVAPEDWNMEYYNRQLFYASRTVESGIAELIPGVLSNTNVPDYFVGAGSTFQAASSSFNAVGANKMSAKRWAPAIIDDDQKFDLMTFIQSAFFQPEYWKNMSLLDWPDEIVDLFLQMMSEYRAQQMEQLLWLSDSTLSNAVGSPNHNLVFIDGFIKQMRADSSIYKVSNPLPLTAGATTSTERNILEAMRLLRNRFPALMQDNFGMKGVPFFMSINDFIQKFVPAVAALNTNVSNINTFPIEGIDYNEYPGTTANQNNPTFLGYPIIVLPFIPDNFMFITPVPPSPKFKNLKVGVADWNNMKNIRIVDLRQTINEDFVTAKTRFNVDVKYMRGDRIAVYDGQLATISIPDMFTTATSTTFQELQGGVLPGFNRNGYYGTFSQLSATLSSGAPLPAGMVVTFDNGDGTGTTLPGADVGKFDSTNNALLPGRIKIVNTAVAVNTYTLKVTYRIVAGSVNIDTPVLVVVKVS